MSPSETEAVDDIFARYASASSFAFAPALERASCKHDEASADAEGAESHASNSATTDLIDDGAHVNSDSDGNSSPPVTTSPSQLLTAQEKPTTSDSDAITASTVVPNVSTPTEGKRVGEGGNPMSSQSTPPGTTSRANEGTTISKPDEEELKVCACTTKTIPALFHVYHTHAISSDAK